FAVSLVSFLQSEGKLNSSTEYSSHGSTTPTKLSKRESLKAQKKNYRREKKRVTKELLSALKDPSIIVMADYMKVRGSLKGWTKLWCVLKPGLLVIYKSPKHGQWVGTILLNNCELIERPSKKDGFCFKIYHPLDQSIWATRGPKGETMGSITQPLPSSYLIFRAPSEADGKCWMDALELALRCSSLLMRSMRDDPALATERKMNDNEIENKHFKHEGLDEPDADGEREKDNDSKSESEGSEVEELAPLETSQQEVQETTYVPNITEELCVDISQTETLGEENKSLIWTLMKQVRPGMDLSRVVLPTFVLEPRSFLDKLSDFYFHADIISKAVQEEDPFSRMKEVVRWYLSGFYKKPKGLKKPYNPIIGETFRCMWEHPKTKTRTFYIAEQVSHHPPVTAFYITNRKEGFCISGSILAKSKFYGNSVCAVMDGVGKLTLLGRGEDYLITMPYANCKGILYGTLTMEYGGKVTLECEKTGYKTEIDFKLKPFLGGSDSSNQIQGKIKFGKETLATLSGKWDEEVFIKDKKTEHMEQFWAVTPEVKRNRLRRSTAVLEEQGEFESERLWSRVTEALNHGDVHEATKEKYILEEEQRKGHKERKAKMVEWMPRLFERDDITGDWIYKHTDTRPWDPLNDIEQFELEGIIQTRTRHRTQIVRTTSIVSLPNRRNGPTEQRLKRNASLKHAHNKKTQGRSRIGSGSPDPASGDSDVTSGENSDLSENEDDSSQKSSSRVETVPVPRARVEDIVGPIREGSERVQQELKTINSRLAFIAQQQGRASASAGLSKFEWLLLAAALIFSQLLTAYFFKV
ncbi:oxysterol-binding protein-related protein 8-like, partial [Diadema antillarum]|uniref:oxysterol-binding protein-related protein 8-like n=1 Tax=Diadema antillarum TaxID=105358 RepID=UPI003A85679E